MSDPPAARPRIQYLKHDETAAQLAAFFPGLAKSDLPDARVGLSRLCSFQPITAPIWTRRIITTPR